MPPPSTPLPTGPMPPPTSGGTGGGSLEDIRKRRPHGVDLGGWQKWWEANWASLIGRKPVHTRVTTDSPLFRVGGGESGNRTDAERPTVRAIEEDILPTLRWVVDPKNGCEQDTVSSAYLAMAKVARSEADVKLLLDACRRRGDPALIHESAVLALGCLRRTPSEGRFDGRLLDQARGALFAAIDDDELPMRARCFGAFGVGLLGDQACDGLDAMTKRGAAVVRGLWMRVDDKHSSEDLPVALLIALSLQSREAVPTAVLDGLRTLAIGGRLNGRAYGPLARAQALLTLARLSDSTGAGVYLGVLKGRTGGEEMRRAAVASIGIAAPRLEAGARRDAALTLCELVEHEGDADSLGLMFVSAARLLAADGHDGSTALLDGTPLDDALLKAVDSARTEVRPFAALALGLAGRGVETANAPGAWRTFREKSLGALHQGLVDERLDPQSRGAWCLGVGLLEDESALVPLRALASKKGAPDDLRGYACLAMGLVGLPTPEVVQTLRAALREHATDDLRRQAAIGLGQLGDVSAVPLLLLDLETGGSDHVLAQDVIGLGAIGDVAAVPPLVKLARDAKRTELLRAIACAGLGLVGDLETFPSLTRLGADCNYANPTDALSEALTLL